MSQVWKLTGTPENWLTAFNKQAWALNEYNKSRWPQLKPGDTLLFHSTRESTYTTKAISAVVGYGFVGETEKYVKKEFWWPDEIKENKNIYPYVVPLKEIYVFSDISNIDTSTPLVDKTKESVKDDIDVLLGKAITVADLNQIAHKQNPDAPNFNVMGPVSRVHDIYEEIIFGTDKNLFVVGKTQGLSEMERRTTESIDDRLSNLSKEELLERGKKYQADGPGYVEEGKPRMVRRESQIQKVIVARLEDFECQVCGYKQEYTRKNGKKGWIIEIDHILDKSEGGNEDIDNLWALCPNCHSEKTRGVLTVNKGERKILKNGREVFLHHDNHLNWRRDSR